MQEYRATSPTILLEQQSWSREMERFFVKSVSLAIARRIVRFGRLAFNVNRRIFFQTAAALALLLSLTVRAGDWPQFRGPLGNGVAQEYKAPLHWGPTNNVRWKATLPGPGNSSPIVSH